MRYRLLAIFALITACGGPQILSEKIKKNPKKEEPEKSEDLAKGCFNLVNGIETQEQEAVVLIETPSGYCTGTFVSDNTLITAAHCANNTKTGGIKYKKINPIEVTHYGKLAGSKSKVWEDLLIVTFPAGTSKSFVSLSNRAPNIGDRITIIGFGQTDLINDNKPDGRKRKGYNTITNIAENQTVLVYEAPRDYAGIPLGERAMTGRGDSGGPVFLDGFGLVGIVSRGSLEPVMTEYDVNLFSVDSLKLMEAAVSRGAKINGIDYVRSATDPKGSFKGTQPVPSTALSGSSRCQ
jgi:hypothetical protein